MLFASGFARPLPCGVLARRFFRSTRMGSFPQSFMELSRSRRGPAKRPLAPRAGAFARSQVAFVFSLGSQLWDLGLLYRIQDALK